MVEQKFPAARKRGEIFPRMTVSVMDAPSKTSGRPVFEIVTSLGGIGSPGDAHSAIVIGAANGSGENQPYSAVGSVPTLSLVNRPRMLVPDEFAFNGVSARGTAQSNGFMAGTLASILSAGAPQSADLKWLCQPQGGAFTVPNTWLTQLSNNAH